MLRKREAKQQPPVDRRKVARETEHPTRAPRLEGVVKNARMKPVKKPKKKS